ncbi:MAG: hypothetical protein HFJ38_07510 [Bacilli bacterium]|nr:hypothetical protein [Bacilli bacterium]
MLIADLLRSIGIPAVTRNLMVDYCDAHGNYFHSPMQATTPPDSMEKDTDLVSSIQKELKQKGYEVCSILEALGEFEMGELEEVFNGKQWGKHPTRLLYLDAKLVQTKAGKVDKPQER